MGLFSVYDLGGTPSAPRLAPCPSTCRCEGRGASFLGAGSIGLGGAERVEDGFAHSVAMV